MSRKSVSDLIAEEMQTRRWAISMVSNRCGLPYETIQDILDCDRDITRDDAACLAHGFGTSIDLWVNLAAMPDPIPVVSPPAASAPGVGGIADAIARVARDIGRAADLGRRDKIVTLTDRTMYDWRDELRELAARLAGNGTNGGRES